MVPRGNDVPRRSGTLLVLPAVRCLGGLWGREDFRPSVDRELPLSVSSSSYRGLEDYGTQE